MKREIITTADGSKTIQISDWNEHYHSKHGAIQESRHVFLQMGLAHYTAKTGQSINASVHILEMGLGTGLNALLTLEASAKMHRPIRYTGIEAYPITPEEMAALAYYQQLAMPKAKPIFEQLHHCDWEAWHEIQLGFHFYKRQQRFEDFKDTAAFDIIYFDAFGARVQPELWGVSIFEKMYNALRENGILVTYAAKGSVRRAMQEVGFTVERLPGPPGKREMLRASKLATVT